MRRARGVFLGVAMAVPFAGLFATAVPAAATGPTCSGSLATSFSAGLAQTHGGTSVSVNGSHFNDPVGTPNFSSGGTIYFSNASGQIDSNVKASFPNNGSASLATVTAPSSAYSGPVQICINGDSYGPVNAGFYTFQASVRSISPSSATEGSTVTVGGQFYNRNLSLTVGQCGVTATFVNESALTFTVPGPANACSGTVSVDETPQDSSAQMSANGGPFNILPRIAAVSPGSTYPGQPITISGSGFSGLDQVLVGGGQASPSGASDGQIVVPAPDGMDSINSIQVATGTGSTQWGGNITLLPHLSSVSPSAASDGAVITLTGVDFGSGSSPGAVTLGGQALTVKAWGMDQVQAAIPAGAVPGKIALVRGDDQQAAGNQLGFSLKAVINGMSPTKAPTGTQVYLAGSTFGSTQGSVTVGGARAPISLWSDTAIEFQVPKGAQSGKVIVTTGYGSVLTGPAFTVTAPGTKPSGQTVLVPCAICSSSAAGQINGFLPPPNAPPPIALHLTTPVNRVDPGSAVPLTVTMTLNGKPLAGSKVALSITSQPSTDGILTPANGVTDAKGQLEVNLKLSSKVGATLVTATSGTFSDTLTVLGIAPPAPVKTDSGISQVPAAAGLDMKTYWPFAVGIGVAILLLLSVLALQIWLHRHGSRQPAPAPAPVPEDKPRRTRRAKAVEVAAAVAAPAEPASATSVPVPATEAKAAPAKKAAPRKAAPRTAPARRPRKKVEVAAEEPAPAIAEIVPLPTLPNDGAKRRRRKVVAEAPPAEVAEAAPISRTRARAKKTS